MRLKLTFELLDLEDHVVAIPIGDHSDEFHGVIKLNETAAFIFEQLKQDTTEDLIVDTMEQAFDAPRSVIAAGVRKYIREFQEKGLLIE